MLDAAHAALMKNGRLQFDLADAPVPKSHAAPPTLPGEALRPLPWDGSTLGWIIVLIAIALGLLTAWRAVRQRRASVAPVDVPAPPPGLSAAVLRITLATADGLAAAGRFAEAAHALLTCGVEEIDRRYPALLRPATTSRDLVERGGLPDGLRQAFALIAATVEKSLFAGRPITAADYAACRQAFASSALAGSS